MLIPPPKGWRSGVLIAEWFEAPENASLARLPATGLRGLPADAELCLTLLAADGAWRSTRLRPASLEPDSVLLAFAGLGDGGGLGLVVQKLPGIWAAPTARQVRWMWRWLRRRAPLGVGASETLPPPSQVQVPLGRAEDIHLLGGQDMLPKDVFPGPDASAAAACLTIERFWRESGQTYLEGWVHAYADEVLTAEFLQDEGAPVEIVNRHARPDLVAHYPMLPPGSRAGFSVRLPKQAGSNLVCRLKTTDGSARLLRQVLPGAEAHGSFAWDDPAQLATLANAAWEDFYAKANAPGQDVLELGSRVVAMGSVELKTTFGLARRYVGLDIHPGPGVDIVGDAHDLSSHVGSHAFDAIFSSAVLEHLAMPWLAAVEMNKSLRGGGLVFHRTHQCWPAHERPNDFFRFSDEALKTLFGPVHGFEPVDAGMAFPIATHARDKSWEYSDFVPLNPAFGMSWIVARKTRDIDAASYSKDDLDISKRYPVTRPSEG